MPILVTLSLFSAKSVAQSSKNAALNVGDTIPKEIWHLPLQVVNHHQGKSSITLNNYRGKLIILDFWATWCSSCITVMPKMEELQNKFGNSLAVMLVTREKDEKVKNFLKKRNMSLPSVTGDSTLNNIFRHLYIPHYAVISPSGIVSAIPPSEEVTAENIKKLIESRDINLSLKKDKNAKPLLFTSSELPDSQVRHYSIFLQGKIDGYPSSTHSGSYNNGSFDILFTNVTLLSLYKAALRKVFPSNKTPRLVLNIADSSSLFYTSTRESKNEWYKNNMVSYELLMPEHEKDAAYTFMLSDLNRYSQFNGALALKEMPCLSLVVKNPQRPFPAKTPIEPRSYVSPHSFKEEPFDSFVNYLDGSELNIPVINGTGYTGRINIMISSRVKDLTSLKKELEPYNLDLKEVRQAIEVFVITDK